MGAKDETTIAMTPEGYRASTRHHGQLLASSWLERWERSGAKFPSELEQDEQGSFELVIRQHEQFQRLRETVGGVELQ